MKIFIDADVCPVVRIVEKVAAVLAKGLQRMIRDLKRVLRDFCVKQCHERSIEKMSCLIKDTTKQERIELVRSWVPDDEAMDGCDIDLWEMYHDYIDGKREISEINASFNEGFYEESDLV